MESLATVKAAMGPIDRPFSTVAESPRGRDRLVLAVVDDDGDIRRSLERLLRSCGHEVCAFESAEAYLAQNCAANCVILDIQLPGISGFELEQRLRREGRDVAVVFITGRDDLATWIAAQKTRRHFLKKPFDDEGLLTAIASANAHRR